MGMFFHVDENPAEALVRPRGFRLYRTALEASWKRFAAVGFITLVGFIPLAAAVLWAVAGGGALALIPASLITGAIAGPFISCMVDCILRALRGSRDDWWHSYKRAWGQNWRASLLPGAVFGLATGFIAFTVFIMVRSGARMGFGTVALILASFLIMSALFLLYWPQLVLFDTPNSARLKNCLLFALKYFLPTVGAAAVNLVWCALAVMLLPWTAFLVPVFSVWYVWFLSIFLIYGRLDEAYSIEERIFSAFPEQDTFS